MLSFFSFFVVELHILPFFTHPNATLLQQSLRITTVSLLNWDHSTHYNCCSPLTLDVLALPLRNEGNIITSRLRADTVNLTIMIFRCANSLAMWEKSWRFTLSCFTSCRLSKPNGKRWDFNSAVVNLRYVLIVEKVTYILPLSSIVGRGPGWSHYKDIFWSQSVQYLLGLC